MFSENRDQIRIKAAIRSRKMFQLEIVVGKWIRIRFKLGITIGIGRGIEFALGARLDQGWWV